MKIEYQTNPNIVLDPNEVFRKKPKPLDKGVSDD
jgi:hypothetical protein